MAFARQIFRINGGDPMLRRFGSTKDYGVTAIDDGELGSFEDLSFEEASWAARHHSASMSRPSPRMRYRKVWLGE
jgi:hypothetical protein